MTKIFSTFEDQPTLRREQELLLRALLAPEGEGREALGLWVAEVDFDALDTASFRLIPALFARWGTDPAIAPHRGRMKGIYRYFMFRSNLVAEAARPAIVAVAASGIEALAIKGLAMGLAYHKNVALRPMADVDMLVRHADLVAAEEVLANCGWRYRYGAAKKRRDIHSHDYIHNGSGGFDLHWFALPESGFSGADDGVWARAQTFDWQGQSLGVPAREDLALFAMVNAMRETDRMNCVWIYDVATLVQAAEGFDWTLLWDEAGQRGVRAQVFSALHLLSRATPWLMPESELHRFLATDETLTLSMLRTVVAETRTDILTPEGRDCAARGLASERGAGLLGIFRRRATYDHVAAAPAAPKHLRIARDDGGEITGLYLRRQHIPLLTKLFTVGDEAALVAALGKLGNEGKVAVPSQCLGSRETNAAAYSAKIDLAGPRSLTLPAGEAGEVPLFVHNSSTEAWTVAEGSAALYGASYHLQDDAGMVLAWDQPRTYFMIARPGTLAFVAPGQQLACSMKVHAPEKPGRYRLQLDVLRETVTWFSAMGGLFPIVELEVIA